MMLTAAPVVLRRRSLYRQAQAGINRTYLVEYNALGKLLYIVPCYWVGFQMLGFLVLWIYWTVYPNDVFGEMNVSSVWASFFFAVSGFQNCGFGLTEDSLVSFNRQYIPLITMMMLIMAGNTAYPIMMRFIVWALYQSSTDQADREVYRYLLDYPRRCFTHLFPSTHTWWLLTVLISLNAIQVFVFWLNDWDGAVVAGMTWSEKLLNGLYLYC